MVIASTTNVFDSFSANKPESAGKTHVHISTEGFKYIAGGNGVFVNSFCKVFSARGCKTITVLPMVGIIQEKESSQSITHGYKFADGKVILVERCSDDSGNDVYRLRPEGHHKQYFDNHVNPYNMEKWHSNALSGEFVFKTQRSNDSEHRSAAAISLKFCAFNKIAANFVNEVLVPSLMGDDIYVHDHFFGGSLPYIQRREKLRTVSWIHSLSPHVGFSDCLMEGKPVYATEDYLAMSVDELSGLREEDKPVRERAIRHADVVVTVSAYAQKFLKEKHPLVSTFLSINNKDIKAIKSYSDLSGYKISEIARRYGIQMKGESVSQLKTEFKLNFFQGSFCLKPPSENKHWQAKPIIFFMGRPAPEKGIQHVLNMLNSLDCLFFIVSNGAQDNRFIQQVCKIRNERKNLILLTTDQQDKQLLMAIADYAVIPSLAESLGLVAGECGAMGMHVIISGVGGLPESSPACDDCRTIIHSDAEYGLYSEKTNQNFLNTVREKVGAALPDSSHIEQHVRAFHSEDWFVLSIENALSN